ncbi:hypothetical protein [Corynebacterium durum]|uniref:hypothetical protein n=1 Tax=Corynebacterium durum TaxID=61592 RepID=UPI0015C8B1F2|nr:hypothetical protein [Corynebacterium durum]NYI72745.1 hypothetical protein [Corynebacterium durum]NYI75343.1 hypothetical protein [Corynebacterium durum]WJY84474.1 hypothetical protein CDUR_03595 [Corynebacterium durum]
MGVNLSGQIPGNPSQVGSVFDLLHNGAGPIGTAIGQGFTALVDGIASALAGGIAKGNPFYQISEATKPFRDGQRDIQDRIDLLSPLLDYGAVTLAERGNRGNGKLGFYDQVGPLRGMEVLSGGGFKLLDKGLWDIDVQLEPSTVLLDFGIFVTTKVEIRVLRPNGSTYAVRDIVTGYGNRHTMNGRMSVVVPEAGYRIEVWCTEIRTLRTFDSGERSSILAVQHISRKTS